MNIIICDKCGKRANTPYCNPEEGKGEEKVPCEVKLTEGYDETNCTDVLHVSKDKKYDLCRSCFEKLREIVEKFDDQPDEVQGSARAL